MLLLYRILFVKALIVGSPFLIIKALMGKHGIRERFGYLKKRTSSKRLFWFHAASVGELKIISSVVPEIRRMNPDIDIAISTTTITGKRRAREIFGEDAIVFLQPLELKSAVMRALRNIRPDKLIVVETEIWPVMLAVAADAGVGLSLINGRMTAKSSRLYGFVRPLFAPILKRFENILVRTEIDGRRFSSLGAENIKIVGNIKYDQVLSCGDSRVPELEIDLNKKLIFVAGSIRRGEDKIFADLVSKALELKLPVVFILTPRHMKDVGTLCRLLRVRGIGYRLWSKVTGKASNSDSVLIVNTMGELSRFYGMADIAFVGGSLVPTGGHDPVEPASLGKPVVFGPFMDNAREAALLLLKSGGAMEVRGTDDLFEIIRQSVEDRSILVEKGRECKRAIESLAGASARTAKILIGEPD